MDGHIDDDFIQIFNSRMCQLLKIKQADYTTHRFYGTFKGKGENRSKIELTLTDERTFLLTIQNKDSVAYSEGLWENENDSLVLTSKKITHSKFKDRYPAEGNWIELDAEKFRLKYRYKRSKLIKVGADQWKLKKVL